MGVWRYLSDGLINALTGMGGSNDTRRASKFAFCPLSHIEIEAAYRGSGLMRKIIDIPAFDMVREWRDWQADTDEIEALEAEEARLDLQAKVLMAETLRGLGGGALILGAPGSPADPLGAIGKQGLRYIHVVSRWQLSALNWIDDPTQEGYGGPASWQVSTAAGQVAIHPSRVVCFRGDPIPLIGQVGVEDRFWGESRVARVMDAVANSDTAQAAFAFLIQKARNTVIGVPGLLNLTSSADGEARIAKRMQAFSVAESIYNVTLKDNGDGKEGSGESIDHHQLTWAGIPEIIRVFAEAVASVADIPMTRLWGRAAEGMNASGDSQQKDWNKTVRARQNLQLRPCLAQLDKALIPSALGKSPGHIWYQFSPLDTPSEKEEAERFKITMEAAVKAQDTGAIPDRAFAEGFQNLIIENGWLPGIEKPLGEMGEDERFGLSEEPEVPEAANENQVEELRQRGAITQTQADSLLTDARPRSLYVRRDVVNVDEIAAWAKAQGLPALQPGLHVTIIYSETELDWMKVEGEDWNQGTDGRIEVPPGGVRLVEPLGDRTAVLLFTSSRLSWRHEQIVRAGANHGFESYQPHISLTGESVDLTEVEPYRGRIVLGPEIFEEVRQETL